MIFVFGKMIAATGFDFDEAYLANLNEERIEKLPINDGSIEIKAAPGKIITIELAWLKK